MKKCLVAPDSFKGTLSATEVCHEVEDAFAAAMPCCSVVSIPIADGGEGTLAAVVAATGATLRSVPVLDPLGRGITAPFAMMPECQALLGQEQRGA